MNFRATWPAATATLPFLALFCLSATPTARAGDEPREIGRRYTTQFYQEKLDGIWEKFDDTMKKGLVSLDNLKAFRKQVGDQLGEEIQIVSEDVTRTGGSNVYIRHARFKKIDKIIDVTWAFDEQGAIHGFYVRPAQKEADSHNLDYQTKTHLRVPFDDAWYVFWGGRTLAENYHAANVQQRFALDLLILKDGVSHTGDGKSNDQYHCFGKPILAPADGTVVAVEDGVADNVPGVMNSAKPLGNHVVLDHGNGEFSFLVHFKQGTVKVRQGQAVKAGDRLAQCGNSGNSSEPHLHYHLQTAATFNQGFGLPAQFQGCTTDGKPTSRAEPSKAQVIQNTPAKP